MLVALLMTPDISSLLSRNRAVIGAYEDRIARLRIEIDRLHSRQLAQAGDMNMQLQELGQQQELLMEQQLVVRQLADKAVALGLDPAPTGGDNFDFKAGDTLVPAPAVVAAADPIGIAALRSDAARMLDESNLALAGIAETAVTSAQAIADELGSLGLRPDLPAFVGQGAGGPFIPATDAAQSDALMDAADEAYFALARFQQARSAMEVAPIHRPLDGIAAASSGFGNRRDPFTGGRAFHSGIDLPAPQGTLVRSAGSGTVTFVGQKAGYGNVVEITHAAGLVTRYGHLSTFLVAEGQPVEPGKPIAEVGSTGRSTGPHLHFEVRRGDRPVDPVQYLSVGHRLARYLGA